MYILDALALQQQNHLIFGTEAQTGVLLCLPRSLTATEIFTRGTDCVFAESRVYAFQLIHQFL